MKRTFSLLLVLVLIVGLLAGCTKGGTTEPANTAGSGTSTAGTSNAGAADTSAAGEVGTELPVDNASAYPVCNPGEITLSYWYPLLPPVTAQIDSLDQNPAMQEMEKVTGIHIEWIHPSAQAAQEQYQLLFLNEDLPDMVKEMLVSYIGGIDQAIKDESYIDINPYSEFYPNYYNTIHQSPKYYAACVTDEGHIKGFGYLRTSTARVVYGTGFREDVFNNVGVAKRPELISDWDAAFSKLSDAGYKNFINLDNYGAPSRGADYWVSAWEASASYINVGGKVEYGPTRPAYKDYLKQMKDWYSKGYIVDGLTDSDENLWTRSNNPALVGTVADGTLGSTFVDNHAAEDPNFYLAASHYARVKEDQVVHTWANGGAMGLMHTTYITTACQNIEAACRWCDYWYSDDGYLLCNYGVEGVSYDFDENGYPMLNDYMFYNPDGIGVIWLMFMNCFMGGIGVESTAPRFDRMPTVDAETEYYTESKFGTGDDDWNMSAAISMTAEESTEYTQITSDLDTYVQEYTAKCIMGQSDIDSTYDAFVAKLGDMKLERAIAIYQQALDRFLAR